MAVLVLGRVPAVTLVPLRVGGTGEVVTERVPVPFRTRA